MNTFLKDAIATGDISSVHRLLTSHPNLRNAVYTLHGAPPTEAFYNSPLVHVAAHEAQPAILRLLLAEKIPLETTNPLGYTALEHVLMWKMEHIRGELVRKQETLRILLRNTPFPENHPLEQKSAFHQAFSFTTLKENGWIAQCLLDEGVRQDLPGINGLTPAMNALANAIRLEHESPRGRTGLFYHADTYLRDLARYGMDFSSLCCCSFAPGSAANTALRAELHSIEASEIEKLAGKFITMLQKTALDTRFFSRSVPAIANLTTRNGRLLPDAQIALSVLGAAEFFSARRWAGHEREAIQLCEELKPSLNPYWHDAVERGVDKTALLRSAGVPSGNMDPSFLIAARAGRKRA